MTASAQPFFAVQANADNLAPGSYRWQPSIAPEGPMNMIVDLTSQRTFVYRGGKLIGVSTIASGKPGYETPRGTFSVLEKEKIHHSNKYDNAPMPYMERLSWSGLALHGGHPHGYPASHGCIRLPTGFAAALFKEHTLGMPVVIIGHTPNREEISVAGRARTLSRPGEETADSSDEKSWSRGLHSNEPPCCKATDRPVVRSGTGDQPNDEEYGVNEQPGQYQGDRGETDMDDDYRYQEQVAPPDAEVPPG